MAKRNNAEAWAEAKKRCRLNETDIQMAKEMGIPPKSLNKNIPTSKQQWKAPVKVWVRELYEKKFGRILTSKPSLGKGTNGKEKKQQEPVTYKFLNNKDLPF